LQELLDDELAEDDRDIGCPLPSTPIDASILHDEVNNIYFATMPVTHAQIGTLRLSYSGFTNDLMRD
jgi:hypothetical protein